MTGSRDLAIAAALAASSKQARDIVVMDVRELIGITDFFVIAGGSSDRQVRAVAEEIRRSLKARGARPVRREGERDGRWVLLDFVDIVVHVFHDQEREFYGLERLWSDASTVDWEQADVSSG